MDVGETPQQALVREVQEETGYQVIPGRFIGLYAKPDQDDLVISLEAKIVSRNSWQPNSEIAECGFYGRDELPVPMHPYTLARILDAFEGKTGLLSEF